MTGLKVIDGTPTAISKYLRDKELEDEIERLKKDVCKYCIGKEAKDMSFIVILKKYLTKESELKGRKDKEKEILDDEIKFLEEYLKVVRLFRKNIAGLQRLQYPIQERLQKLKGDEK